MNIGGCCTLGVTWFGTTTDEADMALNLNFNWFTDGSTFDVETVFLHENGHVAGLGHSAVIGAVMEPNYAGERRALHADDIAGVTLLYPVVATPLDITTTSLPDGTVNEAYGATLQATGGTPPYNWTITAGALLVGLSLDPATGAISGIPTVAETQSFTVTVTDDDAATDNQGLSITINAPPPLDITTLSLPDGTVDEAYGATLQATGGATPYSWAITAGALPAGLSLDAATGGISGTPTTAETQTFTVTVTDDDAATDSRALSITVNDAAPSDVVTITKAAYNSKKGQLQVEATSSGSPGAALTAYDNSDPINPVLLGQLDFNSKKGRYIGKFNLSSKPQSVLITSSLGGSDTSPESGR